MFFCKMNFMVNVMGRTLWSKTNDMARSLIDHVDN